MNISQVLLHFSKFVINNFLCAYNKLYVSVEVSIKTTCFMNIKNFAMVFLYYLEIL